MKRLPVLFLVFTAAALALPQQALVVVPIENPSFEQGTFGWKFGPSSGITQLNGKTVAYAGYSGAFSQTLGISPSTVQQPSPSHPYSTEGIYTLKFSVANYFPSYPGYYTAEVSFGTQELCEASGWGMKSFTQITVVCPGPGYLVVDKALPNGGPVQGSNDFAISFSTPANGWQLLFDNVSLTFTPD